MPKHCLTCGVEFNKKSNYSKNYWAGAKYCSHKCGRAANNPIKPSPNDFIDRGDYVELVIKKNGETHYCKVDKEDYNEPYIKNYSWHFGNYPARMYRLNGKWRNVPIHLFILPRVVGYVIDHANGDKLDNRRSNLRYLTHGENIRNQRIRNVNGVPGVRKTKGGKFKVRLCKSGAELNIGVFNSLDEARNARINAEKEHWGHSFLEERLQ